MAPAPVRGSLQQRGSHRVEPFLLACFELDDEPACRVDLDGPAGVVRALAAKAHLLADRLGMAEPGCVDPVGLTPVLWCEPVVQSAKQFPGDGGAVDGM